MLALLRLHFCSNVSLKKKKSATGFLLRINDHLPSYVWEIISYTFEMTSTVKNRKLMLNVALAQCVK